MSRQATGNVLEIESPPQRQTATGLSTEVGVVTAPPAATGYARDIAVYAPIRNAEGFPCSQLSSTGSAVA